ncbi:protein prenylyltransferase [Bimuria novae-zelandiae CBS 107.79]|uniref:Protein prenylyltransferase n=1 Tax=Bimuria novae-zelandiae CBS 107.79 TaxID=1447943 RepID=A0A6A5UV42_9PLEO|nr:protein prenylyltransferase [Bimuria novae-zelandiae CBS 107.79]
MSQPSPQQTQLQPLTYTALNAYLTAHAHEVVEIEILPPALEPSDSLLLEDGANLGLPKKVLALAYVHARHVFFENKASQNPAARLATLEATRVMLLFDPEHLTAANYRKRALLWLEGEGERKGFMDAVWKERRFLDSILTSPLHRQSKSPTLWAHRAWLLKYFSLNSDVDFEAFFTEELEAVMKSGERHPKNYYAWQYARTLLGAAPGLLHEGDWVGLRKRLTMQVRDWCCQHPSDVSGWMFLAWLLERGDVEVTSTVLRYVVEYAASVRLVNESLWLFVRRTEKQQS